MTRRVIIWALAGLVVSASVVSVVLFSTDDLPWMLAPSVGLLLGVLIETKARGNVSGRLMMAFGASTLLSGVPVVWLEGIPPTAAVGWADAVANAVNTAGVVLLPVIMLRFPDGRPLSRRWRVVEWVVGAAMVIGASAALLNGGWGGDVDQALVPSPLRSATAPWGDLASTVFYALLVFVNCAGAVSLVLRFRRSEGEQRHQLKWLAFAGAVVVGALAIVSAEPTQGWEVLLVGGAFSLIPMAVGVAVLRYRLYDIDLVINRSVLFLLLGGFITAVYALVVVVVGAVVGSRLDLGLSIFATAVVAFAFEPVRVLAQRWANRIAYGDRATPYEVLSDLTRRLATAEAVQGLLDRIAGRLAAGTGAERVGVWMDEAGGLIEVGAFPERGRAPDPLAWEDLPGQVVAVEAGGHRLGALTIEKRRGDPLTPTEHRLIADLAGSSASVLRNLGLQSQLGARADELAASRRRLVDVQDLERRRMERELDEGAQQLVVSLKVKLNVAARLARGEGPEALADLLDGMGDDAREAITQIRSLARGLYPPLLEAEGLAAAVRSVGDRAPVPVEVVAADMGRFSPELEAALFFATSEAITNAAKHAPGLPVKVTLTESAGWVTFEVEDQGPGFDSNSTSTGSGLRNMADRIDAVGGRFGLVSAPGRGTRVRGSIPVSAFDPAGSAPLQPVSG